MTEDLDGAASQHASGEQVETEERTAFDRAVARVEYRLTFDKCDPRSIYPGELLGPDIPCAFTEGRLMPGEWYDGESPSAEDPEQTEQDWFAHFAKMAVNEAVHEALEWLKVDGRCWLNPHGEHERAIYREVNRMCARLAKLAAKDPTPRVAPRA